MIEEPTVPYTILRATQFHPLLDTFLGTIFRRGPFLLLPIGTRFQLIDAGEVAQHMVQTLANGPSGRLPDIGGPKVEALSSIARDWLRATHRRLLRVPIPPLGAAGLFNSGANLAPENPIGQTWQQWLAERYPA